MDLFTLRHESLGKSERHATDEEIAEIAGFVGGLTDLKVVKGGHELLGLLEIGE